MPKVLIADKLSPLAEEHFRTRGIAVDVRHGLSEEELIQVLPDYDGLALRSATQVSARVLEAAGPKLKVIGRAGIGVDNIDVAAATAKGIVVMNTPYGNAVTTAEHSLALIFALARAIPAADLSTQAGKWEKSRFMGAELSGKTLGIIGCGNIGSLVAERALGLRMKVVAYDPFLSEERAQDLGVERLELPALLASADIITLHTPLTEKTRGIIDKHAIAKMKPGVRIVNCARGGLVVEADLKEALETGRIAGAALDVFEEEPAHNNPLFGSPNLICTPHLGAATHEAQEKVAVQIAEQMADYLVSGAISNAVNMPSLTAEEARHLGPYMALGEQLGSFAGQITRSSLSQVTIEYEGQVAALNCRPLTRAILMALLRPMLDSVNMVNAPEIARERNIAVSEIKHDRDSDYQTLIRLTVESERQTRSVAGTLFGGKKPRLVAINKIPVEAQLGAHMLYTHNADKPGVIGALGTLLAEAGVNIATFHLGRTQAGGEAIALIEIDSGIDPKLLEKILGLAQVNLAIPLRF